jgi:hypothetical protein
MPRDSRLSGALSEFAKGRWAAEPPLDPPLHPSERGWARSGRLNRALLTFAHLLIAFCIGIGAAAAWQSYGDEARGKIASLSPRLGWLAPQPAPIAQIAAPVGSAGASSEQIAALSRGLAAVRQSVDRLAADIAKLHPINQDAPGPESRVVRTSAPPLARKPTPVR